MVAQEKAIKITQDEAVEVTLSLFPKLYYFVPPIEPIKVRVPKNKADDTGDKVIEIKEPLGAILWLLEVLAQEDTSKSRVVCSQADLYKLISRLNQWDRPRFSEELGKLRKAELVTSGRAATDGRINELTLTPRGVEVLNKIKEQRTQLLTFLFQGRKPEELKAMVLALSEVAKGTWLKMKSPKLRKSTQSETNKRSSGGASKKRRK